ncbi:MAG: hypothetical protein COB48_08985 [Pseudoalteromonas sp.]|nr:MAG: hypothetical protein COB48_08985 [Pseudoalteromonas sp.]
MSLPQKAQRLLTSLCIILLPLTTFARRKAPPTGYFNLPASRSPPLVTFCLSPLTLKRRGVNPLLLLLGVKPRLQNIYTTENTKALRATPRG